MKKIIAGLLTCTLIMSTVTVFADAVTKTIEATFGQVKLVVNGNNVDKETLLYDGRTYLPLRDTAEALGMEVGWDESTSTASLTTIGKVVEKEKPLSDVANTIKITEPKCINVLFGKVKLVVNGKNINKETMLYDGRTYLPLRDTAETLGMEVSWDENTNTASLVSPPNENTGEKAPVEKTEDTPQFYKDPESRFEMTMPLGWVAMDSSFTEEQVSKSLSKLKGINRESKSMMMENDVSAMHWYIGIDNNYKEKAHGYMLISSVSMSQDNLKEKSYTERFKASSWESELEGFKLIEPVAGKKLGDNYF